MEIDLAAAEGAGEPVRSPVCIVGAGIAGLTLARKLVERGVDVVVVEGGGHKLEAGGQQLFETAQLSGQPHIGTIDGRARIFGGTSLWWGGQVLAMSREAAAEWPIAWAEMDKFAAEAERLLAVDALPFEGADFFAGVHAPLPPILAQLAEVDARVSKWMTFSRRNLAGTMGRDLIAHARARIYLHAQVTELLLEPSGTRLVAAMVRNPAGESFRFEAEHFVLAAGTVETSRLLLASRTGAARERMLRELRPWVLGGTVHSVKFEASRKLCSRLAMNPILAHIAIEETKGSGIAVVRECLAGMQQGDLRQTLRKHVQRIPGATVEVARLLAEARLRHRRFVSHDATVKLQFNAAQDRPSGSRITLGNELDGYGLPRVVVDWRVSQNELATLRTYAGYLRERFDAVGLKGVEWVPEIFDEGAAMPGIEDARHAMGGACMGSDSRSSVVDAEMTVHGVANLSIAGAATFPTGGPQLPTLTMMALALRLGERLAGRLA
jgi:choline dehydrogenase-like flavoprotein